MFAIFSPEWAAAYHAAINASAEYASAGQSWREGTLAMVLLRAAGGIAIIADLHEGACRSVQSTTPETAAAEAAFVIEADEAIWREVLSGQLAPLMGLMRGKLKLSKGSLTKLMPHTKGAAALVECARQVPTVF